MFCKKCGKELTDGAKFCAVCGTPTYTVAPLNSAAPHVSAQTTARKTNKNRTIIIVVAIICALIVAGVGGFAVYHKVAIDQRTTDIQNSWQEKVDAVATDGTDHATQLANYRALESVRSSIEDARAAGDLQLPDKSECDLSSVTDALDERENVIRNWFATDYEAQLAQVRLSDSASSENTSSESAQSAIDALSTLQTQIASEKEIWGTDTGSGSRYDTIASAIATQLQRANDTYASAAAAEQQRAEEEAKEAQIQSFRDRLADLDNSLISDMSGKTSDGEYEIHTTGVFESFCDSYKKEYGYLSDDLRTVIGDTAYRDAVIAAQTLTYAELREFSPSSITDALAIHCKLTDSVTSSSPANYAYGALRNRAIAANCIDAL